MQNIEEQAKNLYKIISDGTVTPSTYLISNPFSIISNERLDGILTESLFWNRFFVPCNRYYDRISTILGAAEMRDYNTIFITGFRGCGKTTFVNYLKRLINGDHAMLDFIYPENISKSKKKELVDIMDSIIGSFYTLHPWDDVEHGDKGKLKKICIKQNDVEGFFRYYKEFIDLNIHGSVVFLNFESGIIDANMPFQQKLNSNLKKMLDRCVKEKINNEVAKILLKVNNIFSLTTMEKRSSNNFSAFFDSFIKEPFGTIENSKDMQTALNDSIKDLGTEQLLSLIVLLDLAMRDAHKKDWKKIYYIFDNIDVAHDENILEDFMQGYATFVANFSKLYEKIIKNNYISHVGSFHKDICFIFVMRESTEATITEHLKERLMNITKHFDMSTDVEKYMVAEKKINFIVDSPEKKDEKINAFSNKIHKIKVIMNDHFIRERLNIMFNNDYKRIIACLSYICNDSELFSFMKEYINEREKNTDKKLGELGLNVNDINYRKHGYRGIMFHIIFNHFYVKNYFQDIGICQRRDNCINFTVSRFILLYLNTRQYYHNDKYMLHNGDRVSLSELFSKIKILLGVDDENAAEIFIKYLTGMYNLRSSKTWNHLITLDSVGTIYIDNFKHEDIKSKGKKIFVRITCAGRSYVRYIASHFEFYSLRFSRLNKPLFSKEALAIDTSINKYMFEYILNDVCSAIESCCDNMYKLIQERLLNNDIGYDENRLLGDKEYVYVEIEGEDNRQTSIFFHEEYFIHQHITYIDSFRMFLVNPKIGRFKNDVEKINKIILPYLERYIELLNKYDIYSKTSKEMYKEFSECIKYIKVTRNFECCDIDISRKSYSRLRQEGEIQ